MCVDKKYRGQTKMPKPKQPDKEAHQLSSPVLTQTSAKDLLNLEKTLFVGTRANRLLVFTSSHDIFPPSAVLKQIRVRVIK